MENVTLNVKGMSCGHCVKAVEGSVGALAGVEQVDVNLEAGKVNVAYNDQRFLFLKSKKRLMIKATMLNN